MPAINFEEEKAKFRFKMNLEIRWSDMDEMKHVNNAVYLTYIEQARILFFHNVLQIDWEQDGFILANANIDFIQPMVYPNASFVYMRTSRIGTKSFESRYLISSMVNGKEELMAAATTTQVMFDYNSGKSIVVPEIFKQRLSEYEIVKP